MRFQILESRPCRAQSRFKLFEPGGNISQSRLQISGSAQPRSTVVFFWLLGQPARQPTGQPAQPAGWPASSPARRPIGRPASLPISLSARRPASLPAARSGGQLASPSAGCPVGWPRPPDCQPTGRRVVWPAGWPSGWPGSRPAGWPAGRAGESGPAERNLDSNNLSWGGEHFAISFQISGSAQPRSTQWHFNFVRNSVSAISQSQSFALSVSIKYTVYICNMTWQDRHIV